MVSFKPPTLSPKTLNPKTVGLRVWGLGLGGGYSLFRNRGVILGGVWSSSWGFYGACIEKLASQSTMTAGKMVSIFRIEGLG